MITLYGFGPGWGLPDTSPYVTKVDCYLRMVGLPYEHVPWQSAQDLLNAPKGKFPYIEDKGRRVTDSEFILDYLRATYGDTLGDLALSPRDHAIARSLRIMMEERLNWVTPYTRWLEDVPWEAFKRVGVFGVIPAEAREAVLEQIRESVRGQLHAQGLGRHSREEIYLLANGDLSALAAYLEDKPFLLGDTPKALDASAFGILAPMLNDGYDAPHKTHLQSLPNLVAYWHRLHEKYYPN